jgi:hypothetical protein
MEIKWFQLLRNVKKWWIFMFSWTKRVMEKYKTFFCEDGQDMATKFQVTINFDLLINLDILLLLSCIFYLLETMNNLSFFFCKLKISLIVISLMQSKFSNTFLFLMLILPQNLAHICSMNIDIHYWIVFMKTLICGSSFLNLLLNKSHFWSYIK